MHFERWAATRSGIIIGALVAGGAMLFAPDSSVGLTVPQEEACLPCNVGFLHGVLYHVNADWQGFEQEDPGVNNVHFSTAWAGSCFEGSDAGTHACCAPD
jgi:hypothetical protein